MERKTVSETERPRMKQMCINWFLSYLRMLAGIKVKRQHPWIVGVTGSVGKSSFLSLAANVLGSVYNVKTTTKGNSETGLPLEILGLRESLSDYSFGTWMNICLRAPFAALKKEKWNCLVAEMGIDSPNPPKNMDHLLSIIRPDVGVFLSVAPVHTEQFAENVPQEDQADEGKLLDAIAHEKGKLVTTLLPSHTAICNADNPRILALVPNIRATVVLFGKKEHTNVRIVSHTTTITSGTTFVFEAEGNQLSLKLPQVIFEEYGTIIAAVLATGKVMHVPYEKSLSIIKKTFVLPPGRFSVFGGKKGSTLLDSSYNSSPDALFASLTFLSTQTGGRRIAVLGDMRELGPLAEIKHRETARLAATCADSIILVGPLMKKFAHDELIKLKFPKERHFSFLTSRGVGDFVASKLLRHGDTVLVKGSQNTIFLEEAVKELLADSKDMKKLCRQSDYWDGVRNTFFGEKGENLV
jgi:UDP-N-acetylmuramoyl-tripeptide--D-alanyl-D-alanine ligase